MDRTALFDFNIDLHPAVFFAGSDREHVGLPTQEMEAILHILEVRIPQLKDFVSAQDDLLELKDKRVALLENLNADTSSNAADWKRIADGWKEAATAKSRADLIDRILSSPVFWGTIAAVVGAVIGAGAFAIYDKLDGKDD